jgi:hypothetical protein
VGELTGGRRKSSDDFGTAEGSVVLQEATEASRPGTSEGEGSESAMETFNLFRGEADEGWPEAPGAGVGRPRRVQEGEQATESSREAGRRAARRSTASDP